MSNTFFDAATGLRIVRFIDFESLPSSRVEGMEPFNLDSVLPRSLPPEIQVGHPIDSGITANGDAKSIQMGDETWDGVYSPNGVLFSYQKRGDPMATAISANWYYGRFS